jgi:hypothetical protein
MGTITHALILAVPAGAPMVGLSCFDRDLDEPFWAIWGVASDMTAPIERVVVRE